MPVSGTVWRTASRSVANGACVQVASWRTASGSTFNGNCVEVASWRSASRSTANGQCVEVGAGHAVAGVRDSKDPDGPVLLVPAARWQAFTAALQEARR